jgi:hypothetical protein
MKTKYCAGLIGAFTLVSTLVSAQMTVTFDDFSLVGPDSFYNGSDLAGGFTEHGVHFHNDFNTAWNSWQGFSVSNVNDPDTAGFGNQYAAFSGTDRTGTGNYAVGYGGATAMIITLPTATLVQGFYAVNTTYAAKSMLEGDAFARAFAAGDYFRLTVTGRDASDAPIGFVEFDLANYEHADPNQHYVLDTWTWVDLSSLGSSVKTLTLALDSTDQGPWGMNTPAYFAMDDFTIIPEPASMALTLWGLGLILVRRRLHR